MKLIHRANACFSLFHEGKHILLDPWLNGPAVAQGWTPFPPAINRIEDLPKPDLVYISHVHSDHCEPETMEHIDRETPILIMDLGPNFLYKMLLSRGFTNIILMKAGEETKVKALGGLTAEPFGASFGHICANVIDSGVVFRVGDKVLLNCNDNKPSPDLCHYLKDKYEKIDLALIPGGGGGGYPAMYENLTQAQKQDISRKNVENYANVFSNAVDILKPRVTIPVAGGYAIRGPKAETANWIQNRSLNHDELINFHRANGSYKEANIILVQPGLELDVAQGKVVRGHYRAWSKSELLEFFKELSLVKIEPKLKTEGPVPSLKKLLTDARTNLWNRQQKLEMIPNYSIYLELSDYNKCFELKLNENSLVEKNIEDKKNEPYLRMKLDQDTMMEWLLGYEDFNMLDSGHRISFFRKPNDYIVEAYYLMSMFRL